MNMNTLAFVTITLTSVQGVEWKTTAPVECSWGTVAVEFIESQGRTADMFCEYTLAPVVSVRPQVRPVN